MSRLFPMIGLCLLLTGSVTRADNPKSVSWPQFRGPNRDDHSPDKGLLNEWPADGPPLAWKATGLGAGYASVSLADGKLYTMGDKNGSAFIHALDPQNGKILWSAKIGRSGGGAGGSSSTPTVN